MDKLNKLIDKFIEATEIHGKESRTGNYKLANKNYKIAEKCYKEIKSFGEDGYNEIAKLLLHENGHVRVGAAYHLLPVKSEIAVKVLKESIGLSEGIGFIAGMILSEWEKGKLKF